MPWYGFHEEEENSHYIEGKSAEGKHLSEHFTIEFIAVV